MVGRLNFGMKKFLYILLPLFLILAGCYAEKPNHGSNIRMGKQNKRVAKKNRNTHKLGRLRKQKHQKGIRKTNVVKIQQSPKKDKYKKRR
jgi:hypothetical protein